MPKFTEIPPKQALAGLINSASKALKIEEALTWEGGGMNAGSYPVRPDSITPLGELVVTRVFSSTSTVEHVGDEEGLTSSRT